MNQNQIDVMHCLLKLIHFRMEQYWNELGMTDFTGYECDFYFSAMAITIGTDLRLETVIATLDDLTDAKKIITRKTPPTYELMYSLSDLKERFQQFTTLVNQR